MFATVGTGIGAAQAANRTTVTNIIESTFVRFIVCSILVAAVWNMGGLTGRVLPSGAASEYGFY